MITARNFWTKYESTDSVCHLHTYEATDESIISLIVGAPAAQHPVVLWRDIIDLSPDLKRLIDTDVSSFLQLQCINLVYAGALNLPGLTMNNGVWVWSYLNVNVSASGFDQVSQQSTQGWLASCIDLCTNIICEACTDNYSYFLVVWKITQVFSRTVCNGFRLPT